MCLWLCDSPYIKIQTSFESTDPGSVEKTNCFNGITQWTKCLYRLADFFAVYPFNVANTN